MPCSIEAAAAERFGGAEANALLALEAGAEAEDEGVARVRVLVAGALAAVEAGVARADLAEVAVAAGPVLDLAAGAEEAVEEGAEGALEEVERKVPEAALVARLGTPCGRDDAVAVGLRC